MAASPRSSRDLSPTVVWSDRATPERVEACRAAEAAFAVSPGPLVSREDGSAKRVPSYEEWEIAREAFRRSIDLKVVEPGLGLMSVYWSEMGQLIAAAMSDDRDTVNRLTRSGLMGGDGQVVDFWAEVDLLNVACAEAGTVTKFNSLATHMGQP